MQSVAHSFNHSPNISETRPSEQLQALHFLNFQLCMALQLHDSLNNGTTTELQRIGKTKDIYSKMMKE
jgi:hypothetical protein